MKDKRYSKSKETLTNNDFQLERSAINRPSESVRSKTGEKKLSNKEKLAKQMQIQKKLREQGKKLFTQKFIHKDDAAFKRQLLLFISLKKRCSNCGFIETKIDDECNLIICPVLKRTICHTCKYSEAFKCISATSAARKYKVDKKDIDMLNLPYLEAPNPYYTALKMRLYYEFMIVENLHKIQHWRNFKKEKLHKRFLDHVELKRKAKVDAKEDKAILALEIEFRRRNNKINRMDIQTKYVEHPLFQRFLANKTRYKLNEIVDLIDEGKAEDIEARIIQKEIKLREAKYAKKLEKEKERKL